MAGIGRQRLLEILHEVLPEARPGLEADVEAEVPVSEEVVDVAAALAHLQQLSASQAPEECRSGVPVRTSSTG